MNPNDQLTLHFQLREFLHNGSMEGVTPEIYANLKKLAERLEEARKLLGNRAMHISSGFRTVAHNRTVGGKAGSFHLQGKAADFTVAGMQPRAVQTTMKDWNGGMEYAPSWTHLDIGPKYDSQGNIRRFTP